MSTAQGLPAPVRSVPAATQPAFSAQARSRYARHADSLTQLLSSLYGEREDFQQWLARFLDRLASLEQARGEDLRELDQRRLQDPDWLARSPGVAYSCYVDRFAGNLAGVRERIPHLREFGVRVLHLLPFLKMRQGANDGGFAVSDFASIQDGLGSLDDLRELGAALRGNGISLMADIVLNHVADDHPWARAAMRGDAARQQYFLTVERRDEVDAIEAHLDQVFPDQAPGNFTWNPALARWVWTTFFDYQWDLNYQNPEVFAEMALAMVHLANLGVEVFRVDSAPYIWKRIGTDCRNQPEVHVILRALRVVLDIVAPATLMNAEAIVEREEILRYFGEGRRECSLAYNAALMAATWVSLIAGSAAMVRDTAAATPQLPAACVWVNYARCHDDIIWSVLRRDIEARGDDYAAILGGVARSLHGQDAASYSRGVPSQSHDPLHGTSGMTSDLVGLRDGDEDSWRRYALVYAVAFAMPGIPLVYMGDELGQGNAALPQRQAADDTRWLHRPALDEAALAQRHVPGTTAQRAFSLMQWFQQMRRQLLDRASGQAVEFLAGLPQGVLGLRRGMCRVLLNFSGTPQRVALADGDWRAYAPWQDAPRIVRDALQLPGYGQAWLWPDAEARVARARSSMESK